MTLHEAERAYRIRLIGAALARHGGNKSAAARELGISRRHLMRLLIACGIPPVTNMSNCV